MYDPSRCGPFSSKKCMNLISIALRKFPLQSEMAAKGKLWSAVVSGAIVGWIFVGKSVFANARRKKSASRDGHTFFFKGNAVILYADVRLFSGFSSFTIRIPFLFAFYGFQCRLNVINRSNRCKYINIKSVGAWIFPKKSSSFFLASASKNLKRQRNL